MCNLLERVKLNRHMSIEQIAHLQKVRFQFLHSLFVLYYKTNTYQGF